jgi:hypothetical protein
MKKKGYMIIMSNEKIKKIFGVVIALLMLLSIGAGLSSSTITEQKTTAKENSPSQPLPTYTHKVLTEEGTATWGEYCHDVTENLWTIYESGQYNFQNVALVDDMNTYAHQRNMELVITGFPTVVFDGGYTRLVGNYPGTDPYTSALNTSGARAVWNLDETLSVRSLGNALLNVSLNITNHHVSTYYGHIHVYVTEINSRWWNGATQYHFAMIGNYALHKLITIPAHGAAHYAANWDGNLYGMGDIQMNNIMVVVAIFKTATMYVDDTVTGLIHDYAPPEIRNQGQNKTVISSGESISLYAQGKDAFGLNWSTLATNESGSWQNISGKYGSPMNMSGVSGQWTWSNFTWHNPDVPRGTTVGWKIYYNDTSGNTNCTNVMSFFITEQPEIDPVRSFVTLTNENMPFLVTCPAADGPLYQHVKITVKDAGGNPLPEIPASAFAFTINPTGGDTHWYGTLSCTFTPVDQQTNANGEIRFTIKGDTSIYGNITIQATVQGVPLNDVDILPCKSVDYDTNGVVSLSDFVIFGGNYGKTSWRSDFTGDGLVSLGDFVIFGGHYAH